MATQWIVRPLHRYFMPRGLWRRGLVFRRVETIHRECQDRCRGGCHHRAAANQARGPQSDETRTHRECLWLRLCADQRPYVVCRTLLGHGGEPLRKAHLVLEKSRTDGAVGQMCLYSPRLTTSQQPLAVVQKVRLYFLASHSRHRPSPAPRRVTSVAAEPGKA